MDLQQTIDDACFMFRGYNLTNLGRTAEFLAHPAYGGIVQRHLREASEVVSDETGEKIDLVARATAQEETCLDTFADAIALIMAVEVAQIQLLEEFFGIQYGKAKLAAGYSLGEVSAVVCGGVMQLSQAMRLPVAMAKDCAGLGRDTSMGIVFSRGPELVLDDINRICIEINAEGKGVIGISSYLSPNTLLILGQADTVDEFNRLRKERLPDHVHLRKNKSHWPPLHTPIMWERNIPNRAAHRMHTITSNMTTPTPTIISLVTGTSCYNDYNAREILNRWTDHPQRVWDAVYATLSAGCETVIHVGPEPNLFPATYKRLADNVRDQLSGSSASSLGMRMVSGMARRPWLTALLPSKAALLRAPFIQHVILENWLLEQEVP